MISKMSLVEVVVPRGAFEPALEALQAAGLVHLEEVPMSDPDGVGFLHRVHLTPAQEQEESTYTELVEALEEALSFLPAAVRREHRHSAEMKRHHAELEDKSASAIASTARSLHARVRSFARRRRNLAADLSALSSYEAVVAAMTPLTEKAPMRANFESNGVVFTRDDKKAFRLLSKQLDKLTGHEYVLLDSRTSDGRIVALLGYPRAKATRVRAFLEKAGISEIRSPRHLRDRPFSEAMSILEEDIADLKAREKQLRGEADEFYGSNAARLIALARVCHDRLTRLDALAKFAKSRYTYVIRGWVPSSSLGNLDQRIREACGPNISLRSILPRGMEDPPVLLENAAPVAPFERLLGLMPPPRYGTTDPSVFLAIFFPPMFGLMLGDVGYGALLAIVAVVLYRRAGSRRLQRELAIVLGYCSFFACAFGFLFGEMFGALGHHVGLQPIWRERLSLESSDRAGAIFGYLAIALGVGALHIVWGLVVGLMNARRTRNRGHVIDRAARLVGLFALFFIAGWLVQFLPSICLSLGIVLSVVFLALMVQQIMHQPIHGFMLPLELLGTVGNIFSYARIMAVGLASVVLAIVANRFGGMIGNVALAGIVVVLVHVLNLALGVIDPTIQGLRLHYVEFFSKFYESNGRPYVPFSATGGTEP